VRAKSAGETQGVTPAELREAERGFTLMLRKRFSAVWIAENAKDLLGQANMEYAEWLEDNPPARNPVGWLLTCAYRRAQNLLDSQTRRPPPASLEAVFHLADESTPTPEQQALEHDRQARLRKALGFLPEKECKLLALVYFEDRSIREAGRMVGWQKSVAHRHHDRALEKMRALVGKDRSLLSPATLGLAAWIIAKGEVPRPVPAALDAALTPARKATAIGAEVATTGTHRLADLWRRISPFTDPSNAVASGGGGRALGACGVAVASVVCGVAASGLVPAIGGSASPPSHHSAKARHVDGAARGASASTPLAATPEPSSPEGGGSEHSERAAPAKANPVGRTQPRARAASVPTATGRQTVNEFGVEAGSAPEPTAAPAPERSASSGSSASARPSSSSRSSSGSAVASEFGM
jgi:RNA polymerase sigma factor (sigma-70 family)